MNPGKTLFARLMDFLPRQPVGRIAGRGQRRRARRLTETRAGNRRPAAHGGRLNAEKNDLLL